MDQHIHDNTDDEITHAAFINAFLVSKGADPVNLDQFRTLPSSQATGAQQIGRLTNLMQLTVDTSWWTRYRSDNKNPDLGDTFPQAVPGLSAGQFPAIPRNDGDLAPANHLQAIANTAGFHFCVYRARRHQPLPIVWPSGSTTWRCCESCSVSAPPKQCTFRRGTTKPVMRLPLTDPTNGLVFPDLNSPPFGGEEFQTNLIMPEPTVFLNRTFPIVSIIRPTETEELQWARSKP